MANKPLAQPPASGNPALDRWMFLMWKRLQEAGVITWDEIDTTGSNLTDIETRNHSDLQNINTEAYSHLTGTQLTDLTDGGDSAGHFHATDRDLANATGQLELDNAARIKAFAASHG